MKYAVFSTTTNQRAKHPALEQVDHRPWPLPDRRPLLSQVWQNLLFIHWEVDFKEIRDAIPQVLEVDVFNGKAWIAIVPFDMKKVTFNGMPSISSLSDFPEINVRTYVKYKGKPGVWFFSLDVPSRFAVWGARTFFHLPYRHAAIDVTERGDKIHYKHRMATAEFEARYWPVHLKRLWSDVFATWATERYCLYCQSKRGQLYRTEVQHQKWPLHRAEVEISKNTLLDNWEVGHQHPIVLFSKHIDVLAYTPEHLV